MRFKPQRFRNFCLTRVPSVANSAIMVIRTVGYKMRRRWRGLTTRPRMPRQRKLSRQHFMPIAAEDYSSGRCSSSYRISRRAYRLDTRVYHCASTRDPLTILFNVRVSMRLWYRACMSAFVPLCLCFGLSDNFKFYRPAFAVNPRPGSSSSRHSVIV